MINSIPQYVLQELLVLLTTIVGSIIVGWFASNILEKKNEVTRIEGLLIEKKLEVYEEIHKRIQEFTKLILVMSDAADEVIKLLKESNIEIDTKRVDYNQIPAVFTDVNKLQRSFLELDNYIVQKRLYFDQEVAITTAIFQNYYCVFNRFWAMYKDQLIDANIDAESKKSKSIANRMMIGLGMMLKEEFYQQIEKVEEAIRNSINNVSMKHRKVPQYNFDFYRDESGVIMQNLKETIVIKERDKIMHFITACTAVGLMQKFKRVNK